jgi:hypothetical protein
MPASDDTASAALLSWPEVFQPAGGGAYLGKRGIHGALETGNGLTDDFTALLARTARLFFAHRHPLPLDHVIAKDNDGAGHRADLIFQVGCGDASAGVAIRQPFHRRAETVQRLRNAAPDQPAESKSEQSAAMPTPIMKALVRLWELTKACDEVSAAFCAVSIMLLAAGSICSISVLMMVTNGSIVSTRVPHYFRLAE